MSLKVLLTETVVIFIIIILTGVRAAKKEPRQQPKLHMFKEKSNREFHDRFVSYVAQANPEVRHSIVFAVRQQNIHYLIQVLHNVSDPLNPLYGQHLTKSMVAEITSNKEGCSRVLHYLKSTDKVNIDHQTMNCEFIFATAPVHVWEDMFATTFHVFETRYDNKRAKTENIIRAEEYSLIPELDPYVSTVFNTVQFSGDILRAGKQHHTSFIPSSSRSDQILSSSSRAPTRIPTVAPHTSSPTTTIPTSSSPSTTPTIVPSTLVPSSLTPSIAPSVYVSVVPSAKPSPGPSNRPITESPTIRPTTLLPSTSPSAEPSNIPSSLCPSARPTSGAPTTKPSPEPSFQVTGSPSTTIPSPEPSFQLTRRPSTTKPTAKPSIFGTVPTLVTPALINMYYNVSRNTGSMRVSQAVVETDFQAYSPTDLSYFQKQLGIPLQPVTKTIGGFAFNNACNNKLYDCSKANLDVQYIMGIAQNVSTTYHYSAIYSEDWMLDWITSVADSPKPSDVYSISYGVVEYMISKSYADAFNVEAIKLGVMGSTIVASSGDDGALSYLATNISYCGYVPQFPASSPYVVAVGATNGPQVHQREVACQSGGGTDPVLITSGGGFSNLYPLPTWQSNAVNAYLKAVSGTSQQPYSSNKTIGPHAVGSFNSNGRGYPDVSLLGHNYRVVMARQWSTVDGTSASTPVMAAFVSLVNSQRVKAGKSKMGWLEFFSTLILLINPFLYKYSFAFTNDITQGNNKCSSMFPSPRGSNFFYNSTCCMEGFYATTGWDPVTGLGSINFDAFLATALSVQTVSHATAPPASPPQRSSKGLSGRVIAAAVLTPILFCLAIVAGLHVRRRWKDFRCTFSLPRLYRDGGRNPFEGHFFSSHKIIVTVDDSNVGFCDE